MPIIQFILCLMGAGFILAAIVFGICLISGTGFQNTKTNYPIQNLYYNKNHKKSDYKPLPPEH